MLFWSCHRSSSSDERFVFSCFHASSDDENRSPFQLFLVHTIFRRIYPALNENENDNETISISWQNVLGWWMAQIWKDSWDDSLPFNIVTCLLRSFRCYAYSLAAPHCFSPSPFISGTQIVKLHLKVWDWWQLFTGAREHSVFSDDLIDLAGLHTWDDFVDSCHQSESCGLTILCWGKPRYWTMSMVWLSYADAGQWKAWTMSLWELIRTSSNKLNLKLVSELETGRWNCDLQLHWKVSYHTIQLERCKRKHKAAKDAADAEVEV